MAAAVAGVVVVVLVAATGMVDGEEDMAPD